MIRDWCAKWTLCGWSSMPLSLNFLPWMLFIFNLFRTLWPNIPYLLARLLFQIHMILYSFQGHNFQCVPTPKIYNQCHLITVGTHKYFPLILTFEGKCLLGWWDDNLCLSISYGCEHCLEMLLHTTRSYSCYSLYLLCVWSCMEGTKLWISFPSKHR